MTRARLSPGRRAALVAATLYLAGALWTFRVILPSPASNFPHLASLAPGAGQRIDESDQRFVAWGIARNARTLLTHPTRLFAGETCHPDPDSVTLGENMFGEGLLGVLPYAFTRDPIVTYNAVLILGLWLSALAMYALAWHWTASAPAAFIAGLVFAFHPERITNPSHPFVHGNQWTPLALLFAHRLFVDGRWRDALGLATFVGLQLIESLYQVIALAVIGSFYGVVLVVRHRARLATLAPQLLAVAGAVAALIAVVFVPYLRTRAMWGVLANRVPLLPPPVNFRRGAFFYPGSVVLVLAGLGLVHRFWQGRRRQDPRLPLLAAALFLAWTSGWGFTFFGIYFPSPYLVVARFVPGLTAVRGIADVGIGVQVAAAFLAAYGVVLLLGSPGSVGRILLPVALAVAAWVEVFYPPLALQSFGIAPTLAAWTARPPAVAIALYRGAGPGAVLDLPFAYDLVGQLRLMAYYVTWGSFHARPMAACYNSFRLPIQDDVATLAGRLPDPRAADALYALGFRFVMLHGEVMLGRDYDRVTAGLDQLAHDQLRIVPLGHAAGHTLFRLASPVPVVAELGALATGAAPDPPPVDAHAPQSDVPFVFHDGTAATYRHPDPIAPTSLLVRWSDASAAPVLEGSARALLPLALAAGEDATRTITIPVPATPGEYDVTLSPAGGGGLVISRRRVQVRAPDDGA